MNRLLRIAARSLLVVASVVGFTLVGPSAQAVDIEYDIAQDYSVRYCNTTTWIERSWGQICFSDQDEFWKVFDEAGDHMSVGVLWRNTETGRHGICRNKDGNNTIRYCNKNYDQGSHLTYRMARCDGSEHNCQLYAWWVDDTGQKEWRVGGYGRPQA